MHPPDWTWPPRDPSSGLNPPCRPATAEKAWRPFEPAGLAQPHARLPRWSCELSRNIEVVRSLVGARPLGAKCSPYNGARTVTGVRGAVAAAPARSKVVDKSAVASVQSLKVCLPEGEVTKLLMAAPGVSWCTSRPLSQGSSAGVLAIGWHCMELPSYTSKPPCPPLGFGCSSPVSRCAL